MQAVRLCGREFIVGYNKLWMKKGVTKTVDYF